jgi:TetR/AcrR family transcriptional regulator, transcriptional repressor for nem operon
MARPREFDEALVLDAAIHCFWRYGFEATSVTRLTDRTGLTAASLYNAFGDKRGLFKRALERYVDLHVGERIERCRLLPPREAVGAFFAEILNRSLTDRERKGCMLVNTALELAPHDAEFRAIAAGMLRRIEAFFLECIRNGQADGTIACSATPGGLAPHLLSVLMGVRVLARVRPETALLEGIVSQALALLDR